MDTAGRAARRVNGVRRRGAWKHGAPHPRARDPREHTRTPRETGARPGADPMSGRARSGVRPGGGPADRSGGGPATGPAWLSARRGAHYRAAVDLFCRSWAALRAAVAGLADEDFARPSGCAGWLVRDLVCHLVIDAQDVLITLATPVTAAPTRDAVTYWEVSGTPPAGDDPLDALTVRLAAAYQDPALLRFHLDDLGSAAGRAADAADPGRTVGTRGEVLTTGEYLTAYVLEWTLHHLDLVAGLPQVPGPPAAGLARSRELLERIAGTPFPAALPDSDALRIGTGRRAPSGAERTRLGALAGRLPFVLG
ncbi:hypothetical protein GCM10010238_31940 [Streptomyces griseoviridis]|uniref:Mycothiol-dependent maleylpyruvate isomerase metal-binding domain-containing protein n=1 Tax=Streptomyces griseoviridis TaxID=45398 RepID=A0A918GIX5_STRGD|nr:hypothetical protein GCM10010238_31940 [Streptomyces niveoruber]